MGGSAEEAKGRNSRGRGFPRAVILPGGILMGGSTEEAKGRNSRGRGFPRAVILPGGILMGGSAGNIDGKEGREEPREQGNRVRAGVHTVTALMAGNAPQPLPSQCCQRCQRCTNDVQTMNETMYKPRWVGVFTNLGSSCTKVSAVTPYL
jgi:hypothetical protein